MSTVAGTIVQKTAGCDGCQDAGATSQEQLSGDGYIEFTVGELNTMWMAGLSHGNDDTTYADIDFGFRFNGGGYADVLENGVYAGGDTTYARRRRIPHRGCQRTLEYSKNGHYLMESAHVPQLPLLLDSSLLSVGATIRDAAIAVAPPPPPGGGLHRESRARRRCARGSRAPQIQAFLPAERREREVQLSGALQHRSGSTDECRRLRRRQRLSLVCRLFVLAEHQQPRRQQRHVHLPRHRHEPRRCRTDVAPIRQEHRRRCRTWAPLRREQSVPLEHWRRVVFQRRRSRRSSIPFSWAARSCDATTSSRVSSIRRPPSISTPAGVRRSARPMRRYLTQPHSSDDDLVHSAVGAEQRLAADWMRREAPVRIPVLPHAERIHVRRVPHRQVGALARSC